MRRMTIITSKKRPIGIDLFAGVGGLSLGFEQAGFDVVAAVEIDPIHAAAHSFNFPNCKTIAKSIESITGDEIRKTAGLGKEKIDVVFGGAPCQGFSLIGQRALDDPRNRLVREFVRIVHELRADYFVFENVKGITVGKHLAFLNELISEFQKIGYKVKLPWQVLNAANYGAPQNRERLILMGCRRDLTLPEYPAKMFRIPGAKARFTKSTNETLPLGPTCADALDDLPDVEKYQELWESDSVKAVWSKPSSYAAVLRGIKDNRDFAYKRQWNTKLLTSSLRTEHTSLSVSRFRKTKGGEVEPVSRFFKLPKDGVANTLRAGTDSARGAFTSPRPIHHEYPRCITVREMARLHGYPDWFRFHKTKWHGARQIGNSVPPPLGRAVAVQILSASGIQPSRPKEILELGDVTLLAFDMQTASAYFGVADPISKRKRLVKT